MSVFGNVVLTNKQLPLGDPSFLKVHMDMTTSGQTFVIQIQTTAPSKAVLIFVVLSFDPQINFGWENRIF